MEIAFPDLLQKRLVQLLAIIDEFHFAYNVRAIIKYLIARDFHSSWHFYDEWNDFSYMDYVSDPNNLKFRTAKGTLGIQNNQQLTRYLHEFISNTDFVSNKSMEIFLFSGEYIITDSTSPFIQYDFRELTLFDFLKKYQLNYITNEDFELEGIIRPFSEDSDTPYYIGLFPILPIPNYTVRTIYQIKIQSFSLDEEKEQSLFLKRYNYFNEWYNCTVTLSQWQLYKFPIIFWMFRHFDISESKLEQIQAHQYQLFCENAEVVFIETYKKKFIQLSEQDQIRIARRDLSMINNLIERNMDSKEVLSFSSVFPVRNMDLDNLAAQLDELIANKCQPNINYDIHLFNDEVLIVFNYTKAEAINQCRIYLTNYIKDDELRKKISGSQRKKDKTASKIGLHSYTYVQLAKNSGAIKDLLDSLINNNVIADTKITNFKKIFNNQIPALPIIWLLGYKALAYFIKLIHLRHKYIKPLGNNIWTITATLFVMEDGTPFDFQVFRQAEPPSKEVIDLLIKVVAHLK